ncbi:hypothetical protein os1_31720 [Comamonadaceae bacterium OS-1]|nr:hypothetical protein os1_31720 [Comamonadaceae bacterium OS-1]
MKIIDRDCSSPLLHASYLAWSLPARRTAPVTHGYPCPTHPIPLPS